MTWKGEYLEEYCKLLFRDSGWLVGLVVELSLRDGQSDRQKDNCGMWCLKIINSQINRFYDVQLEQLCL